VCVDSSFIFALPLQAKQIDPKAYQEIIDENLSLRRDQDRLGREMGDLRRQNAALILDVRDLERKRDQLTVLVSQLKTPEELRNEMARVQAENLALAREVERLREALSVARATPTNTQAVMMPVPPPGSDLFRKVEQENAGLRQDLAMARGSLQSEAVARDMLKKRVAELEAELKKLANESRKSSAKAERAGKVADAYRKGLDKLARHAYQQERDLRDLKEKLVAATAEPVAAVSLKDKSDQTAPAKSREKTVKDRTVINLLNDAEKALLDGKSGEAEKLYLEALKREPSNPRVHYNLGVLYDDYLKQPRKADQYYRQYLDLSPSAPDAAAVKAWILDLESRK
jgi:tetratricopeptide (TPR) repeat protein